MFNVDFKIPTHPTQPTHNIQREDPIVADKLNRTTENQIPLRYPHTQTIRYHFGIPRQQPAGTQNNTQSGFNPAALNPSAVNPSAVAVNPHAPAVTPSSGSVTPSEKFKLPAFSNIACQSYSGFSPQPSLSSAISSFAPQTLSSSAISSFVPQTSLPSAISSFAPQTSLSSAIASAVENITSCSNIKSHSNVSSSCNNVTYNNTASCSKSNSENSQHRIVQSSLQTHSTDTSVQSKLSLSEDQIADHKNDEDTSEDILFRCFQKLCEQHQRKDSLDFVSNQCQLCKRTYKQWDHLKRHLQSHSGYKPHTCQECGKLFANTTKLKRHLLTHSGVKPYSCNICGKQYNRTEHLKRHLLAHADNKAFHCASCSVSNMFAGEKNLKLTGLAMEEVKTEKEEDTLSPIKPSTPPERLEQQTKEESFLFSEFQALCARHQIKDGMNSLSHQCQICQKSFKQWTHLKRHLQAHSGFRPHSCEECGKMFANSSKLKRHLIIHEGTKPYSCSICGKQVSRSEHLKRHLLTHTDSKPYSCSSCSFKSNRLDCAKFHISRRHADSNSQPIVLYLGEPLETDKLKQHHNEQADDLWQEYKMLNSGDIGRRSFDFMPSLNRYKTTGSGELVELVDFMPTPNEKVSDDLPCKEPIKSSVVVGKSETFDENARFPVSKNKRKQAMPRQVASEEDLSSSPITEPPKPAFPEPQPVFPISQPYRSLPQPKTIKIEPSAERPNDSEKNMDISFHDALTIESLKRLQEMESDRTSSDKRVVEEPTNVDSQLPEETPISKSANLALRHLPPFPNYEALGLGSSNLKLKSEKSQQKPYIEPYPSSFGIGKSNYLSPGSLYNPLYPPFGSTTSSTKSVDKTNPLSAIANFGAQNSQQFSSALIPPWLSSPGRQAALPKASESMEIAPRHT